MSEKATQVQNKEDHIPDQNSEDSVAADLNKAKSVVNTIKSKLVKTATPVINKAPLIKEQVATVKPSKKKLKIIIGVILLALVLLMMAKVTTTLRNVQEETPPVQEEVVVDSVPTIPPFLSSDPSIYANDPEILKLEEDINVLKNEMSTTPLRESSLLPPALEFRINFN
jgi:hypothetical protein